ncbi:transcriptional regulator [Kluyvera sp. Awk 3]|uniref:transcriptional regulator n=1 Tax=Kluyvera sp. Awk 3 TaxID=2963956 RepID=UPI002302C8B4|nr:YdaS family helix-turn-helix protein [Kluyvera sp. Awk 3]MDA8487444.1 helix-turn-helix domain-containing protein [Kluyvera sp. Awk 3]
MDNQVKEKISSLMSQVSIGERFGISSQAVGKWLRKGSIPPRRILPLCQILNWQVTPHEIDPLAYPNPTDGLPKKDS